MATPTEFAASVNSDGKTVRKFLRSITPREDQPGKGGRWALPDGKRELTKLRKQFAEWHKAELEARAERARQAAEAAAETVEEETEVDETE